MTDAQPAESATIEFHIDDDYLRKVIDQKEPDSWIQVSISVGETYIWGDENRGVTGFACGIVLDLLASTDAVVSTKRYIIEFEYGPSWMVVEPWDEIAINISRSTTLKGAQNPDERLDIDVSHPITKQGWVAEVLHTAREFYNLIVLLDSSLQHRKVMIQIQDEIDNAETLARENSLI